MKKILICNQKGGVGKSMIADELAFSFERSNTPVAFLDLDNQGGTIHKTNQREDAEVAIIDTPGALQAQMAQWVIEADVIVIPTRTTSRDIEPLLRMNDIIRRNSVDKPVIYILNGWNRWKASADFKQWFMSNKNFHGYVVETLPQSEIFVQASAAGMSVCEYSKNSNAAKAMMRIVNSIRKATGFHTEIE